MAITVVYDEKKKRTLKTAIGINFAAITPSDSAAFTIKGAYARKIFVGNGGDIALINTEGVAVVFENVPDAWSELISFIGVAEAGTTATGIVGIG